MFHSGSGTERSALRRSGRLIQPRVMQKSFTNRFQHHSINRQSVYIAAKKLAKSAHEVMPTIAHAVMILTAGAPTEVFSSFMVVSIEICYRLGCGLYWVDGKQRSIQLRRASRFAAPGASPSGGCGCHLRPSADSQVGRRRSVD